MCMWICTANILKYMSNDKRSGLHVNVSLFSVKATRFVVHKPRHTYYLVEPERTKQAATMDESRDLAALLTNLLSNMFLLKKR